MRTFEDKNDFVSSNDNQLSWSKFCFFLIIALLIGGFTGYGLARYQSFSQKTTAVKETSNISDTKAQKTIGIADKKTFKDQAEGILKEGGIDGEGNFHLQRPGGESQNVYLTSTTVDLSAYLGKKVRVWGQTFTANKAGWLMDVGLVEILQ
jgi:hypothetical protein